MIAWKRLEETAVAEVGWMTITTKTFQLPNGRIKSFDCVYPDGQEFAICLPITESGKVVVARQFRPGPERILDDFPGGFVDSGETPQQAIEREMLEETGYKAEKYLYLGYYHKDAYLNSKYHAFIAYGCRKVAEPQLDDDEFIEVDEVSVDEILASARRGDSEDSALILMGYDEILNVKEKDETAN